jgi:hypothetical protein
MQIEQRIVNGWPVIEWASYIPTPETVYGREKEKSFKAAIVIGVFVAALAFFAGMGIGEALFAGFIVTGGALSGGQMFDGMPLPRGAGHLSSSPRPSEQKLEWERVARVTPIMKGIKGRVTITRSIGPGGEAMPFLSNTLWYMDHPKNGS